MTFLKTFLTGAILTCATTLHAGERVKLMDALGENPQLKTLVTALEAADLTDTLSGDGPFTLYAPSNAAFDALPEGTLQVLLLEENSDQLTNILLYHVDDRKLTTHHLIFGPEHYRPLLADAQLCITRDDDVTIADGTGEIATVTSPDIKVSNGVIHIIDKVLLPGDKPRCHM